MARHNQDSTTVVHEDWIDTVLLKRLEELEERARRCSACVGDGEDLMYDAINVAGLLRDHFCHRTPIPQVRRTAWCRAVCAAVGDAKLAGHQAGRRIAGMLQTFDT